MNELNETEKSNMQLIYVFSYNLNTTACLSFSIIFTTITLVITNQITIKYNITVTIIHT